MVKYVEKYLERTHSHRNLLVAECLLIEVDKKNFIPKNHFPQVLIPYNSDNRLIDRIGRIAFYPGRYSAYVLPPKRTVHAGLNPLFLSSSPVPSLSLLLFSHPSK